MKKTLLFLTFILICVCSLAFFASASVVYTDYTQKGANGENPIFNFKGYAIDTENKSICVEYTVDMDALDALNASNGKSLHYGVVVAYKGFVENGSPLDASGKATGANKDKIIVYNATNNLNPCLAIRVVGLSPELFSKEIVLCLFTVDENGVKYVCDDISTDKAGDVSYSELRGPLEVTINGMTYSTEAETTLSYDRLRQMAESKAGYNTTTMSDSDAQSILNKANLVITGGSIIGWNNAAKLLQHFLNGSGDQYTLDMKSFLSDSTIKGFRDTDLTNALRAAEALARVGETLNINQKSENLHKPSGDWYYAVGSYFTDVDILNLTVTVYENGVKTYNANIRYIATDFYNWNKYDTNPVINKTVLFFTVTGPSPAELYRLHESGRAQEFLTYGEITYQNITWTEGQSVSQISGLK